MASYETMETMGLDMPLGRIERAQASYETKPGFVERLNKLASQACGKCWKPWKSTESHYQRYDDSRDEYERMPANVKHREDALLVEDARGFLEFKREKVAIVDKTLTFQSNIMLFQLFFFVIARLIVLRSEDGVDASPFGAYAVTIGERTSSGYFQAKWSKVAPVFCKYAENFCQNKDEQAWCQYTGKFCPSGDEDDKIASEPCVTAGTFSAFSENASAWTFPTFCQDDFSQAVRGAMPWWMVPVNQGLVAAFQFAFLGFDLPFKPKILGPKTGGWSGYLLKGVVTSAFVVLALKGYSDDIGKVAAVSGASIIETALLRLTILMLSPNFLKALALWGSFFIQSPAAPLQGMCTPKYTCMPGCQEIGFPISPFQTAWLHPMKWLYAVILAPYLFLGPVLNIIPLSLTILWVLFNISAVVKSVVGIPCRCFSACLICFKPAIYACISTIGVICTLFLWPYAKESFFYWSWLWWGQHYWPLVGTVLLQSWAMSLPKVFTKLFAILIGATKKDFDWGHQVGGGEHLESADADAFLRNPRKHLFLLPSPLKLDKSTCEKLWSLHHDGALREFDSWLSPEFHGGGRGEDFRRIC